ncbi:MAG: GNAT family N-acetyltransferase [Wolbachia sp.]
MISQTINPKQLYNLINELYVHIDNEDTFIANFTSLCNNGYKVIGKYVDNDLIAILAYRLPYKFTFGKYVYVDDLVTLPEYRSRGYGHQLIEWLKEESKRIGYHQIHLDVSMSNHLGSKFYLNNGFQAKAYHLSCKV